MAHCSFSARAKAASADSLPTLYGGGYISLDDNSKPEVEKPFNWYLAGKAITCDTIKLGKGAYGQVFTGSFNGEAAAIKISRACYEESAIKEVKLLEECAGADTIAKIHAFFRTQNGYRPKYPVTVMPLYGDNFLEEYRCWRKEDGAVPWDVLAKLFLDVSLALKELAARGICHLDVKPENIMRKYPDHTEPAAFVLGDFNCARREDEIEPFDNKLYVVSRYYRPPEVILGCCESLANIDVWSFGAMIPEFITGYPLFCPSRHNPSTILVIARVLARCPQEMIDIHWAHRKWQGSALCEKPPFVGSHT